MARALLSSPELETYDSWQELRMHIEIELQTIEHSLRDDSEQIGQSAEAIYASVDKLEQLVPQLKLIARRLEDREWQLTERSTPR